MSKKKTEAQEHIEILESLIENATPEQKKAFASVKAKVIQYDEWDNEGYFDCSDC